MRQLLLAAICGMSVFLSGNTGCGEELADDLKEDLEEQVKQSGTECATFAAALNSISTRGAACYAVDDPDRTRFDTSQEDIQECTQRYSSCSASEKAAISEATRCLQTLSTCTEAGQAEWELELDGCISPIADVFCFRGSNGGDGTGGEGSAETSP